MFAKKKKMDEVGIQHHQHLTLILVVAQEILLTALLKEDGSVTWN